MVSTTNVKENGVEATCKLPAGKYRLVGFDLDLTGLKLIDEICQIAAYTPNSQFSQYVMPFRDLGYMAKHRHLLKVATVGKYRMLKSFKTGKVLKTKSEISAVTDFVQWLENLKAEGVILITHDPRKRIPPFLLEVIRKYKLYDRFTAVVKGFANSYVFAEQKCAQTVKSYALYTLGQVLLDKKEETHCASVRARLSYQIVQQLCTGEDDKGSGDASSSPEIDNPAMSEAIRQIATTIEDEEKELAQLKELLERQNSLRPIFGAMMSRVDRVERYRANSLRRLIVEANLTYENLEEAWKKDKREGLTALVKEKVTTLKKPNDLEDLTKTLISHFEENEAWMKTKDSFMELFKERFSKMKLNDATTDEITENHVLMQNLALFGNLTVAWKKGRKETVAALLKDRNLTPEESEQFETIADSLIRELEARLRTSETAPEKGNQTVEGGKETPGDKESKNSSEKSSPGKVSSVESSPAKADGGKLDADTSR